MIVILIIVGLILACGCGAVVISYMSCGAFKKLVGPMAGCMISFEATRDGILEYARENGGRLPKAETWQDDIREYVRKGLKREMEMQQMFDAKTMNPDGDWGCYASDTELTGIAFNSDLSGKLLSEVQNPEGTMLIFEIEKPRKNAAEKYQPLPNDRSPKIMGEPRGWIRYPVSGEVQGMQGGNRGFRFEGSSRRDEDTSASPPGADDSGKF